MSLDHSVPLDDSKGVFEAVKARNLNDERAIWVQAVMGAHHFNFAGIDLDVLFAQRIYARCDKISRVRQRLCKRGERPDAGVVTFHELAQVLPNRSVRPTRIDVASPYPFPSSILAVTKQRGGLRVMDEYIISAGQNISQDLRIAAVGFLKDSEQ